ncbi:MAG: polysaccharide deacetylase [Coriobacteriales bacterium]|nr:polysaccharide deacetylase [Coriobacteriales bacterium]
MTFNNMQTYAAHKASILFVSLCMMLIVLCCLTGGCTPAPEESTAQNTNTAPSTQDVDAALATLNDLAANTTDTPQTPVTQTSEPEPAQSFTEVAEGVSPVAEYAYYRTPEERTAPSDSLNDQIPAEHVCFLTFDDGPSPNTYRILEILDSYGIKATWFVKAINEPYMPYLKDIWADGHQVAIHTYSHEYEEVYASPEAYWADIQLASDLIYEQIGIEPTLVRFPGGSVNDYNRTWRSTILAQYPEYGYHYFDWNVSCGDGATHTADELVYYTLSEADGCHSCCVLMHDSAAKDTTVEALPSIIEYFISEGFVFDVLLSDTFGYHF